jgi:hypothetical protein
MKLFVFGHGDFNPLLQQAGHEVVWCDGRTLAVEQGGSPHCLYTDPAADRDAVQTLVSRIAPDIIFIFDRSLPLAHLGFESIPIPKVFYSIDSHLHRWHPAFAAQCSAVLVAQANLLECFTPWCRQVHWLAPCFRGEVQFLPWSQRVHTISFVGTLDKRLNPQRVALIKECRSRGMPLEVFSGDFKPIFTRSKLVLNQAVHNDLNYRFFEAAGCGAVVVSPDIGHSIDTVLVPNESYFVYRDTGDIEQIVERLQRDPAGVEQMAQNAAQCIASAHLLHHRFEHLHKVLLQIGQGVNTPSLIRANTGTAVALMQSAELDLPRNLQHYCGELALEYAVGLLHEAGLESLGCYITARICLSRQKISLAEHWICRVEVSALPSQLQQEAWGYSALIHMQSGSTEAARNAVYAGLQQFPADPTLTKLARLCGSGACKATE